MLATNFRHLGLPKERLQALFWGAASTIVLLPIALLLPDWFPSIALPAAYTFAMYQIAKQVQGAAFAQHLSAGGAKKSNWLVIGIGVLWFSIVFLAILFLVIMLPSEWVTQE